MVQFSKVGVYSIFGLLFLLVQPRSLSAQGLWVCDSALGEAYLDINNVRARIPNNGELFYRGEPHVYEVPRFSGQHSIFAGSIWIGGQVNGQLRAAASRYGPYEFWAGPAEVGHSGDCHPYDRVYKVNGFDVARFNETGIASPDLADWPTGLGAPTMDASGVEIDVMSLPLANRLDRIIDLAAGERPIIPGDQLLWWVMNDVGSFHNSTNLPPFPIEVHVSAFAKLTSLESVNNATYYKYQVFNKSDAPIVDGYFGIFLDPDIGYANDDYIGSDSLLNLGYAYNSDNFDEDSGAPGYGLRPPAVGVRILRGAGSDDDGLDNNRDGIVDEAGEHAGMSHFVWTDITYRSRPPNVDPTFPIELLWARWPNGNRITFGGDGVSDSGTPANYMFPGDPTIGEYWSEMNTDDAGTPNLVTERRFLVSSGPFSLDPGESTEVAFSVVWAQGEDHLDSVRQLKLAAEEVRIAYENGFANLSVGLAPTEAIALRAPDRNSSGHSLEPTLYWESSSEATAYELELVTSDTTAQFTTPQTHYQLTGLRSGHVYRWRVRPINSFGFGPWSSTWRFKTGQSSFENAGIFQDFQVVQNAWGQIDPPDAGAFGFAGFPLIGDADRPSNDQQTNAARWGIHAARAVREYGPLSSSESFLFRVTHEGTNLPVIGTDAYEMRFTTRGGKAIRLFSDNVIVDVPFELWNIGIGTPGDTGDDVRLIPAICEETCGAGTVSGVFDIAGDHPGSGRNDDPFTDAIYWYEPADAVPGEAGYEAYFSGQTALGPEVFADMTLVLWNGGSERPYDAELPETGTVFRILTGENVVPVLSSPIDFRTVLPGPVTFYWDGSKEGNERLQVSSDAAFSNLIFDAPNIEAGFVADLSSEGEYYWRVLNPRTGWSDTATFIVSETVPPSDDSTPFAESALFQNYPNPFGQETTITFFIPEQRHVRIVLYDILGRRISTPVNDVYGPGRHSAWIDSDRLAGGTYFYRLEMQDGSFVRSFTVVK